LFQSLLDAVLIKRLLVVRRTAEMLVPLAG
jgi:hypothetical protein